MVHVALGTGLLSGALPRNRVKHAQNRSRHSRSDACSSTDPQRASRCCRANQIACQTMFLGERTCGSAPADICIYAASANVCQGTSETRFTVALGRSMPVLAPEDQSVQFPLVKYAAELGWALLPADEALKMRRGESGMLLRGVLQEQLLAL